MILATQVGSTPDAAPQLGAGHGILGAIVGIETNDAAVPDVRAQEAAPPAVMGRAARAHDARLAGRRGRICFSDQACEEIEDAHTCVRFYQRVRGEL